MFMNNLRHAWNPKLVIDLILGILDNYVLIIVLLYCLSILPYNTQSQTNEVLKANRWYGIMHIND